MIALLVILGGFLPALIWLSFWLKEDESPEPKRILIVAFVGGICAIPLAFILSFLFALYIGSLTGISYYDLMGQVKKTPENINTFLPTLIPFMLFFALSEEFAKYFFVKMFIFWRREYDEPADAMIYLIATALGFASVENIFYIYGVVGAGPQSGFEVLALRYTGSTLLHALSSALLGLFIAQSYWQPYSRKEIALFVGILCATLLHLLFNVLILQAYGSRIEAAAVLLLAMGIFILFMFERVKHTITMYYAQR